MTLDEYKQKKQGLKEAYEKALSDLNRECATSNNPYKVGDVITDHIGSGRIRKVVAIYVDSYDTMPTLVYECDNLTKEGEIQKREPIRRIWQCNIKN